MEKTLFQVQNFSEIKSPVVISVPHSGLVIPEERNELMTLPKDIFLRDVDFEIHQMWNQASTLFSAPMIRALTHRYAIDLNRRLDQVDASMIADHPRPMGSEDRGLFWTRSTQDENLGIGATPFKALPVKTAKTLIDLVWRPYYQWIQTELLRAKEKFGFAILVDGHSMPSQGTKFHSDVNQSRADIVPGNLNNKSCHQKISELSISIAKDLGFSVIPNQPYSGGGLTQHFSRISPSIHALQIEVNRTIYMDEQSKQLKPEGLHRLDKYATSLVEQISALPLSNQP